MNNEQQPVSNEQTPLMINGLPVETTDEGNHIIKVKYLNSTATKLVSKMALEVADVNNYTVAQLVEDMRKRVQVLEGKSYITKMVIGKGKFQEVQFDTNRVNHLFCNEKYFAKNGYHVILMTAVRDNGGGSEEGNAFQRRFNDLIKAEEPTFKRDEFDEEEMSEFEITFGNGGNIKDYKEVEADILEVMEGKAEEAVSPEVATQEFIKEVVNNAVEELKSSFRSEVSSLTMKLLELDKTMNTMVKMKADEVKLTDDSVDAENVIENYS